MLRKRSLTALFFIIFGLIFILRAYGEEAVIVIDTSADEGLVNKKIFGSNLLGYDPALYKKNRKHYYGHSDYGAGIWDPERGGPNKEAVRLAKEAGISVLRFPGGCGSHNYDWKKAVGSTRIHNLFGIDEFIAASREIGAEPVITISYFVGNEQDAADLVEYLNSPDDGTHKWAGERVKNGHKDPYGVKYFEFDNETWHGNHGEPGIAPLPGEYANRYLLYREKMKAVDPGIELGAVLMNIGYKNKEWDKVVANITKDKSDFFITHNYPPHFFNKKLYETTDLKKMFEISLAYPVIDDQSGFDSMAALIKKASPAKKVNISISEFNGYFVQDKPAPYRHCLGTALINAELIKFFLVPGNNILMANNWNFCNEYWGMIANGFKGDSAVLYNPYYKRPNYFVFEMYNNHFGDTLVNSSVRCGTYEALKQRVPYLSVSAGKRADGGKIYLMVVNKNMDSGMIAMIDLKGFDPGSGGKAWVLNGPGIDSTNEENHDNVKVTYKDFNVTGSHFEYTFEPHSLTAIELTKKER